MLLKKYCQVDTGVEAFNRHTDSFWLDQFLENGIN